MTDQPLPGDPVGRDLGRPWLRSLITPAPSLPPRPEDGLLGFDDTTPMCPCMRWAWPDVREAIRTGAKHHPDCDGTGNRKDERPMTADLAARVLAAIEETERIAREVDDNSAPWTGQWKTDGKHVLRTYNDHVLAYSHHGHPFRPGMLAHIAQNDPATVLRRCEADRETVDDYARTVEIRDAAAERLRTQEHPKNPRDLDTWDRADREASTLRPVIERLARAYGITTEEVDDACE